MISAATAYSSTVLVFKSLFELGQASQPHGARAIGILLFQDAALVPLLAYRFYLLVHNTRLWGGKRPLVLLRGRSLASRVAAYAGTWGGGDVVKAGAPDEPALGPTRYVLQPDGRLELFDG